MPQFHLKEIPESEGFDPMTVSPEALFTQAQFYGDWQKSLGRKVQRFLVYSDSEIAAYFQVITYPLPLGKSYMYIPYGPVLKEFSQDFFSYLKGELENIAKKQKVAFIRLDFTPVISNDILGRFFIPAPKSTYHSAYFQPRADWHVPLNVMEDELLSGMQILISRPRSAFLPAPIRSRQTHR